MEIKKDIINSDGTVLLGIGQVSVECSMTAKQNIVKVLSIAATCTTAGSEALSGEANIKGRVNFKAVVLLEDSSVACLDYISDYNTAITGEAITAGTKLIVNCNVIEHEAAVSGEREVKAEAIVELTLYGVKCNKIDVCESGSVVGLKKNVHALQLIGFADGNFDVSEETETGKEIKNILLADSSLIMKDIKCGVDTVMISGDIIASVSFESADGFHTQDITMPFCEEVPAPGSSPLGIAEMHGEIRANRIVLQGVEGNNTIKLESTVAVKCPVFMASEKEILDDAYSTDCDVRIARVCYEMTTPKKHFNFDERLSGSINLDDGSLAASKILCCHVGKCVIAGVAAGEDRISIEGLVTATVIYEDEEGKRNSAICEMPYSFVCKADGVTAGDMVRAACAVSQITAVIKRAHEIAVMCPLRISAAVSGKTQHCAVTNIEQGEAIPRPTAGITIYIARAGDTLFTIAKNLMTSPEEVMSQNPLLITPVTDTARVVLIRGLDPASMIKKAE